MRVASFLILAGCPYVFGPPNLGDTNTDGDNDGYDQEDCDDTNSTVHPGAPELCDGLINDCTANTLPGNEVDDDGDGYVECTIDARGWQGSPITGGDDCDDTDDTTGQHTFPSAAPADDEHKCMKDADGDDYGDATPPRGDVELGTDCDDSRDNVYPESVETAVDGLDNDCDGLVDRLSLDNGDAKFTGEEAEDNAGNVVAGLGDVNGDGYDDFAIGADDAADDAGIVYFIAGDPSALSDMSLWRADAKLTGIASGDVVGCSISGAGDVNNDGYDDLLVGASNVNHMTGATYLVLGSATGLSTITLSDSDAVFTGERSLDFAGRGAAGAGDLNGDGFDDIVLGAPWAEESGVVYLVMGSATGPSSMSLQNADTKLVGEADDDHAGDRVSGAEDVNGDGLGDFLVGASCENTSAGAVYLLLGAPTGLADMSLADADAKLTGEEEYDDAGDAVASAGDTNGDGYGDFLVGAPSHDSSTGDEAGAAYLILGAASGVPSMSLGGAHAKLTGEVEYDDAGRAVSSAGDINGDGVDDLLVGATHDSSAVYDAGATYLILGSVSGVSHMSLADADAKITGEAPGDRAGRAVSGAGDTNGDGYDDVLIGADRESTAGRSAGAAYLIFGSPF